MSPRSLGDPSLPIMVVWFMLAGLGVSVSMMRAHHLLALRIQRRARVQKSAVPGAESRGCGYRQIACRLFRAHGLHIRHLGRPRCLGKSVDPWMNASDSSLDCSRGEKMPPCALEQQILTPLTPLTTMDDSFTIRLRFATRRPLADGSTRLEGGTNSDCNACRCDPGHTFSPTDIRPLPH
jgi:hypothetical protein